MDFVVGLSLTARKKDSIWVIVDRLTKTAHFIAVHTTYSVQQYAGMYMDQIVRLHGIPKTIICERGTHFVARFREQLHECLGTKLIRSSSYHPQTDGQTERINQILEDMLRPGILHFDKNWDKCLSLAELSYNNSYQASLKMCYRMWASGLSYSIAGIVFRSPQCVSCDPIEEGNACARKRSNHRSECSD
jgi:NAD-dependent SIR2 family protein deacetylase